MTAPRDVHLVIDQAIRENRFGEQLCYGFAIVFVLVGVVVVIWGAVIGQGLVSLAGSVSGGLFWPALKQARLIRETNIAIRLLEIPLARAGNAKAAAEAIRDAFSSIFGNTTS